MPIIQRNTDTNIQSPILSDSDFEQYLLDLVTNNNIKNNNRLSIRLKTTDTLKSENLLINFSEEAAKYHLTCGGKRVRANIATQVGSALGLTKQDCMAVAAIAELMHNASLVHDDLQDGDDSRRGNEAVWYKYGKDIAICTGDLLISAAYSAVADITNIKIIPSMIKLIHAQTANAIRGQSYDVYDKVKSIANYKDYEQVAIAKSGALLSLPLQLALIASNHHRYIEVAKQIAHAFSLVYQIADDLQDLHYDETKTQKPRALNIVFVLQKELSEHLAISQAKQIALQKANDCLRLSEELPNQSGVYLSQLTVALKNKLLN